MSATKGLTLFRNFSLLLALFTGWLWRGTHGPLPSACKAASLPSLPQLRLHRNWLQCEMLALLCLLVWESWGYSTMTSLYLLEWLLFFHFILLIINYIEWLFKEHLILLILIFICFFLYLLLLSFSIFFHLFVIREKRKHFTFQIFWLKLYCSLYISVDWLFWSVVFFPCLYVWNTLWLVARLLYDWMLYVLVII